MSAKEPTFFPEQKRQTIIRSSCSERTTKDCSAVGARAKITMETCMSDSLDQFETSDGFFTHSTPFRATDSARSISCAL
jgi:hypothetical protein